MAGRVRVLVISAVVVGACSLVAFDQGESQRSVEEWSNTLAGNPGAEVAMQPWTVVGWVLVGLAALALLAGLIGWATRRD